MSSSHHKNSDTSGQKFARNFLAFALFLVISLLSLTCCVRLYFIAPKTIINVFTNEQYVSSLREDVTDYARDLCADSMLPEDTLDSVITEKKLYDIENSYISGALGASNEFTESTYKDNINSLKKDITAAISSSISDNDLTVDEKQKDSYGEIGDLIGSYLLKRLEISHVDKIDEIVNVGKTATAIALAALGIIALILILIIISIGERRYRALRNVVHAINAAAILNLVLICGVEIVKHYKSLVLYPVYLADSVMRYVNGCEIAVGYSSLMLFAIAFILIAVVWKLNRNSKK